MGTRGLVVVVALVSAVPATARAVDPLPEGDAGIAIGYPGDVGIGSDPAVVYADDFEGYADATELGTNWDAAVYQADQTRIATEPDNVFAGGQALEFTVPQQDAELSNAVDRNVSPPLDALFLRYYARFQPPYDVVGSSHNGSMISAQYFDNGQATPGIPADGTNKFLVNLENWRGEAGTPSPGDLNVYVYHPEQRSDYGDHFFPTGIVLPNSSQPFDFGPEFVARRDIIPSLDAWHCYELMVQANAPGERDGRIAFWFDGMLAADFHNLRLRDIDTLQIDRFGLQFHIGSNPAGETKRWYDNVVAARAYVGPMYDGPAGADSTGGGDGPGGTGADATGGGAGSGGGAASDGGVGSGDVPTTGAAATESAAGGDADAGGCGCRTGRRIGSAWWGWLVGPALPRRRRRR